MEKIIKLIAERQKHHDRREESWNEKNMDYDMEEPKEIDQMGGQIREAIRHGQDDMPVDFIVESLTKLGDAPNIVYDDNGHFAVSGTGFQPVAAEDKFEDTVDMNVMVEPEQWFETIREALKHYINN